MTTQELEEALDRLEDYLEVRLQESQVDDTNDEVLSKVNEIHLSGLYKFAYPFRMGATKIIL